MASGSKRRLSDSIVPPRQRTRIDPSPASPDPLPLHDPPPPAPVASTLAVPAPSAMLPPITRVSQGAPVETSPSISALNTALGGLRESLTELPPLQMAVDSFLGCTLNLQVEEQNRQAYDELALDLAKLAMTLQKHVVELKPHDGPYSIANFAWAIAEQTGLIRAQQGHSGADQPTTAEDGKAALEYYQNIKELFQELQNDILSSVEDELKERDMDVITRHLSPVHEAYHNAALSSSVTKRVGCTQGTRVKLLETAQGWAHDANTARIYWLNGMAGTGKTTIVYTLCEMLQRDKLLGASYFCSRNSTDCQDVNRIVPTIAYQLGRYSSLYRQELCKALKSDPDVSKREIGTQFRRLISEPYRKIGHATFKDIVVVIDALDECADEAGTKIVLDMLIRHAANLPIKFFVASRPEPAISESMGAHYGALRAIFWLHDIEKSVVEADIKLYLAEALASINVTPSEVDRLATRAGNLFIFAATAVRYILPDRGAVDRRGRLRAVLELQSSQKHRSNQDIDKLYKAILVDALNDDIYEEAEIRTRQQVLKTVICAREPLTVPALADILRMSDEKVSIAIQPLQSLLYVSEINSTVSALHASFAEFLLSQERAGPLYCDKVLQSSYLAECCFGLMSRSLKFNICELGSSYVLDRDVPDLQYRVEKAISTGLFYSCRYWGDHLTSGPPSSALCVLLDSFLQQHLLFWMEVLNLGGQVGHGDVVLSQALTWLLMEDDWAGLRDFIYDARNFLTSYANNPISLSTPHIYVSALPFTSKDSHVRATYWGRTRGLIEVGGAGTNGRGNDALATWYVGSEVHSIALSSNGRRVASGSDKGEVSVWDVSNGTRVLGPLEGHDGSVLSVAFSPNNSRIASGSSDHTVRVWDAHNGNLVLGPLRGHTSWVFSVAFSLDSTRLASGSKDRTIRMWDAHTGAAIGDAYEGHRGEVRSVAFSPDGRHFVSGSADRMIRVWNWRTGAAALGPMEGHTGSVCCIAYSPDGRRLASGSWDCTVRVWDMSSGKLLADPFQGHTERVTSISFSPNGTQIVSGSQDHTICVWEAESGSLLAGPFEGHDDCIRAVLFTPDSTRVLSGSEDWTLRVWDARQGTTGETESSVDAGGWFALAVAPDRTRAASSLGGEICIWGMPNGTLLTSPLKGHTKSVQSLAFSPDGARIVSCSSDNTLRTWDASTGASLAGPFEGHTSTISSVAFSPHGNQIASGSYDGTIRVWNSHTGEPTAKPFESDANLVLSVAFSPDGTRIVSGSWDDTVRMWDANDGAVLWTSNTHASWVTCVAFSLDGTRIAAICFNSIVVLDAADGAVVCGPFEDDNGHVSSVAFTPNGTRVASGSRNGTVRVQDAESGTMPILLNGHTDEVTSVALSPDGAHIISGSADNTIRLWDVAAATRPDAASLDNWSIDDDGWLNDSQSQRLFWVPSNLRGGFGFLTPTNPTVINTSCTARVDQTTLLGDWWHECYDTSL